MAFGGSATSGNCLDRLFYRLGREFGGEDAEAIVRVFAEEIGGLRLTFPDLRELNRRARDLMIRAEFNGSNLDELGFKYGLSAAQVRRIVTRK